MKRARSHIYILCNGTSNLCATRCCRSKPCVIITHFPCQIAQHKIKWTHQLVIYKTRFQLVKRSPTARGTSEEYTFLAFVFCLTNGSDRSWERDREWIKKELAAGHFVGNNAAVISWRHKYTFTHTHKHIRRETCLTKSDLAIVYCVECKHRFMQKIKLLLPWTTLSRMNFFFSPSKLLHGKKWTKISYEIEGL